MSDTVRSLAFMNNHSSGCLRVPSGALHTCAPDCHRRASLLEKHATWKQASVSLSNKQTTITTNKIAAACCSCGPLKNDARS